MNAVSRSATFSYFFVGLATGSARMEIAGHARKIRTSNADSLGRCIDWLLKRPARTERSEGTPDRSFLRNSVLNQLEFLCRQFNVRRRFDIKPERELHQVKTPAFKSNRTAVFLYYTLNEVDTELKPNPIAFAELNLSHDPLSVSPSPRSCANHSLQVHCTSLDRRSEPVHLRRSAMLSPSPNEAWECLPALPDRNLDWQ